ncbi:oligosaccharide flippase family protein [uncultured Paludibaculum sp.]|uniref:oligosaccharide flippase family protein n=1 Tax=uncultured Paludibaculum sp. TaxID=1765020 RepID=UPI002AABF149|nr:oligosaccharide flippase family protein [uncultured Paludibaculum sp.]
MTELLLRLPFLRFDSNVRRSVGHNAIANIAIQALTIVASVIVSRHLGPAGRGELAAIQILAMQLCSLGTLGLPSACIYYAAKLENRAESVFGTTWISLGILAGPVWLIGWFLLPVLLGPTKNHLIGPARLFLLLVPIQFLGNLPYYYLQGVKAFRDWNLVRLQFPILWLIAIAWLYLQRELTPSRLAVAYLYVMTAHCATWMIVVWRRKTRPFTVDRHLIPPLAKYALPSILSVLPNELNVRLDQLLMASMLPSSDLGYYAIAVTASGAGWPLFKAIAQTMLPVLASETNVEKRQAMFRSAIKKTIVLSVVVCSLMTIGVPILLLVFFGDGFKSSIPMAVILVWAAAITNVNTVFADGFRGRHRPSVPLLAEISGLLVTIPGLIFALPRWHGIGAAAVSFASYAATALVYGALSGSLWREAKNNDGNGKA